MKVRAIIPFTMRDSSTGELTSVADGQILTVTDGAGAQLISDGLADEYTLITPTGTKSITANGSDIDVTQYAKANVAVPQPAGNVSLTENGEGIDIAQYATATVAVPQPTGNTTITENGENIDIAQYATATVAVPNPSTGKVEINGTAEVDVTNYAVAQVVDANLIAENIKKDVTILGVTGTYEA